MRRLQLHVGAVVVCAVMLLGAVVVAIQPIDTPFVPSPAIMAASMNDSSDSGWGTVPPGARGLSMSTLVMLGLVHPPVVPIGAVQGLHPLHSVPFSVINWGPAMNISHQSVNPGGSNEPAAAMHPNNPLLAIVGGNTSYPLPRHTNIENTNNGGATQWSSRQAHNCSSAGDGVPVWLSDGNTALFTSLCISPPDNSVLTLSKSTDAGATWSNITQSNIHWPGFFNDREYLWTDHNLSGGSQYGGRVYLTETLYDPARDGITVTVGLRWSSNAGTTWSDFVGLVDPTEYQRRVNHNSFASLAIQPDGSIVEVWHRGRCCENPEPSRTPIINVENKVMWARSTNGGDTFPSSGAIVTVPVEKSVPWTALSPGNFPWSDSPNIAADPVDGTLYTVWVAYRTASDNRTGRVYLSRGSVDAMNWSPPVMVDPNDAYPLNFQYFPWVQVSKDHVVHVTYGAAAPGGNGTTQVASYYVQSTDSGQTFSAPIQLSDAVFAAFSFMGDYQASSIGGYTNNGQGTILTTWTDTSNGEDRWGRFGTFQFPTPTPTPPTTPTPAATPCPIQFQDIACNTRFYRQVRCLYEGGIVSGYPCGGVGEPCLPPGNLPYYRPDNNLTRGQLSKMVDLAANFSDPLPSTQQTFEDVPSSNPFWLYIERVALHNIVQGYPCGSPGEPCLAPGNRPYIRPYNNATRGQLTKMVSLAAGWTPPIPSTQWTYEDVPPGSTFWLYVEREKIKSALNGFGYACGGPGEPCVPPNNRLYFRPYSNATRGEAASVTSITFFGRCGLDDDTDAPPAGAPGSVPPTVISPTAPPITPTAGSTATSTVILPSPIPTAPLPSPLPTGPVPTVGGTK